MDENIKLSINARYDAFFNAYEVNEEMKKKIDSLFIDINKFGKSCKDSQDFETKFMTSKLNEEYTNLFIEVGNTCKVKEYKYDETHIKSAKEQALEDVADDAKLMVEDITMPARRKAREEFDSKLRDTPLGKVEQANNMFHLFKKFGKKKKTDEDNSMIE